MTAFIKPPPMDPFDKGVRAADVPVAKGDASNPLSAAPTGNKTDIASHQVSITFFQNEYASSLTAKSMTLPELRDLILVTRGKTKGALPWLKGARFGDKHEKKADGTVSTCLRWDGNVLGFDLIELDYDKEVMSFDEAVTTIKAMNVRALIYTTPSHTSAAPRWRILLPVLRGDLDLETRGKLCARINGRFSRVFASESFVLSQSYYYGLALDNFAPDHRCEVIDGRFVDLCDDLFKFQKDGFPKERIQHYHPAAGPPSGPRPEISTTKTLILRPISQAWVTAAI